jgi:hypothetical protein
MRAQPVLSTGAHKAAANELRTGLETNVYYSILKQISRVGTVEFSAAATATWDADEAYTPGTGADMQAVLMTANPSAVQTVLTFTGVLSDDSPADITATFTPPAHIADQGEHMPQFIGVDLIPQGDGNASKKIKSITGLKSSGGAAGGAEGVVVQILELPDTTDFTLIPDPVDRTIVPGTIGSMAIPSGYESAKAVKLARGETSSVSISSKFANAMTGIARLAGHRACLMFATRQNGGGPVLMREFCTVAGLTMSAPRNEGEVVQSASGMATNIAIFV